jgi:hypothetical protein
MKMSEQEKIPQPPKQPASPTPVEQPDKLTERGLPPVDETPDMPPVKPPKEDQ